MQYLKNLLCACISVCQPVLVFVSLSQCLSASLNVCQPVLMYVCQPVSVSVTSVSLSQCLPACLVSLSQCLSACFSICLLFSLVDPVSVSCVTVAHDISVELDWH